MNSEQLIHISFLVFLSSFTFFTSATPSCAGIRPGYYCASPNNSVWFWCFGRDAPASGSCVTGLVCKCGFTNENPCVWPSSTPSSCVGTPGSLMQSDDGDPVTHSSPPPDDQGDGGAGFISTGSGDDLFTIQPSEHEPLVIKFDPSRWQSQLSDLLREPFYDSPTFVPPEPSSYQCSFHPPQRYDLNPSQILIGRPNSTTTISHTPGVTIRLPDKFFGMALVIALDMYGLSPSMILGLAAKESFLPVIFAQDDDSYFIVDSTAAKFNCYAPGHQGLCTDNNRDGPFQVETGGMSSDVASFPQRFYTGPLSVPISSRAPTFTTDNEIMNLPTFRAFHDSWTMDLYRAVVLTSLDFHFRHALLLGMSRIGFCSALASRTSRTDRDSLEFSAAMYTYNRGIFDTQLSGMLGRCGPGRDPVACGLDGYGGHTTNIRDACLLVDRSCEVYDFPISWEDVSFIIDVIQGTYPYLGVRGFHGPIDWTAVWLHASQAFSILASHRAAVRMAGSPESISFRFDWRALFAVIRMHLPPREVLAGPSVLNFFQYWGSSTCPPTGPYVDPDSFPIGFCSIAGGSEDLCGRSGSGQPVVTPTTSSSWEPNPKPCDHAARSSCDSQFNSCRTTAEGTGCSCLGAWASCVDRSGCTSGLGAMSCVHC